MERETPVLPAERETPVPKARPRPRLRSRTPPHFVPAAELDKIEHRYVKAVHHFEVRYKQLKERLRVKEEELAVEKRRASDAVTLANDAIKKATAQERRLAQWQGECCVCLDAVARDVAQLPCGHLLHGGCAYRAIGVRRACPMCRVSADALAV